MNPSRTKENIKKRLKNYVRQSIPIERSHPSFTGKIESFFNSRETDLLQDPYLELLPRYKEGATLEQLSNEGFIHPKTAEIFAEYFEQPGNPGRVILHSHQEEAIKQVSMHRTQLPNGRSGDGNLVVCSGTGSGKTESFLIPIIDSLVREWDAEGRPKQLSPGVRAMILYPMNALVNDQLNRLRKILKNYPFLTMGRYTGETVKSSPLNSDVEENLHDIEEDFTQVMLPNGEHGVDGIIKNEVITRKQWKNKPAHLLVTNFSMLEYLLIRPETNFLFGPKWKYIVLDEAHSYNGALGAEIGWLMRRLKARLLNRGNLRFIATSATLINDSDLDNDEKANIISNTFASRIFPAPAESFEVLFGEPRGTPEYQNAPQRLAEFYQRIKDRLIEENHRIEILNMMGDQGGEDRACRILGTEQDWNSVLDLSLGVRGAMEWCKKTKNILSIITNQENQEIALGDALNLALTGVSVIKSGWVPEHLIAGSLENGLFDNQANNHSFEAIGRLLFHGIGGFNAWNTWRSKMHDEGDPRGSSLPDDSDHLGNPQKIGNKLHFLPHEWWGAFGADEDGNYAPDNLSPQTPGSLSLEGATWMLQVSHDLAVSVDQEFESDLRPERVKVQFSPDAYGILSSLKIWLDDLFARLSAVEIYLGDLWLAFAVELNIPWLEHPENVKPAEVLEWLLREDANLGTLIEKLKIAQDPEHPGDSEEARWQNIRTSLFNGNEGDCDSALEVLIKAASFAQARDSRFTLLDLRYHQLFRGLNGAGIKIYSDDHGNAVDFDMLPKTEESEELGACRICGQTFILTYSEHQRGDLVSFPEGQEKQLLRFSGGRYKWLWALAWVKGDPCEDGDQEAEETNLWFNSAACRIKRSIERPGNEWVRVVWLVYPSNNSYPEFLCSCPNCSTTRNANDRGRYGLITPYELNTTLRTVALEELSREADPSRDPVARCHAGEGRKVLAFSDSRNGAATLALSLQNFWLECTLSKLLPIIADKASEVPLSDEIKALCLKYRHPSFALPAGLPEAAQQIIIDLTWNDLRNNPDFNLFCLLLVHHFESVKAGRILEIAGQNGKDLKAIDAAAVLIVGMLRRAARNSTVVKGGLGLGFKGFDTANPVFNPQEITDLLSRCQMEFYRKYKVAIPENSNWPEDLVNPETDYPPYRRQAILQGNFIAGYSGMFNILVSEFLIKLSSSWTNAIQNLLGEVRPNQNLQELCTGALQLNHIQLGELVFGARFIPQGDSQQWDELLNRLGLAIIDGQDDARMNLKNLLRNEILNIANNILISIWSKLEPNPLNPAQKALTPEENAPNNYLLNTHNLILKRLHPAANVEYDNWELEYKNQQERDIIYTRIEEHTAQLDSGAGAAYQRAFSEGSINLLSCSTTFEMGVDLGDLSIVFLANLPPSPSNYRQRAGRAGRRPGSPAYVITFFRDTPHDRYYWKKPQELFFGRLNAPTIHLDNPVIRARHLRAEALHLFLRSSANQNGTVRDDVQLTPPGVAVPENYERGWYKIKDFLVGELAGRANAGLPKGQIYRGTFPSLVDDNLVQWCLGNNGMDDHIRSIQDCPDPHDLGYSVAKDFAWQIKAGQRADLAPYPLTADYLKDYQRLGGPNVPEFTELGALKAENDPTIRRWRWTSMEYQSDYVFKNLAGSAPYFPLNPGGTSLTFAQSRYLNEQTLEWLGANRVLPKYGFPVDVVEMETSDNDAFARRVDLKRDLKIGLYEYAPEQEVVADKRIYRSRRPGNFAVPGGAGFNIKTDFVCDSCNEIHKGVGYQQGQPCGVCTGTLQEWHFCDPDYFRAERSRAGRAKSMQAPARLHLFSGGATNERELPGSSMKTAESKSGYITYVNQGRGGSGYLENINNITYFLRHEVRTDIAVWVPQSSVYLGLQNWGSIWQPGVIGNGMKHDTRLQAGIKAALQAILRGIALEKNIKSSDLGGIVSPDPLNRQGGRYGFILFDDSEGGAGAVLDLILNGQNDHDDQERQTMIRNVLRKAIEVCECHSCVSPLNAGKLYSLSPICREDYLALPDAEKPNYRVRESCYECLKSYTNQREHEVLDRHDAKRILELMLGAPAQGNGGGGGNQPAPVVPADRRFVPIMPGAELPPGTVQARVHLRDGSWVEDRVNIRALANGVEVLFRKRDLDNLEISQEEWEQGGWIELAQ